MRGKPSSPPQDYAGYKARAGGNADLPSSDRGSMRGKPSSPPQDYAGYKATAGGNADLPSSDRGSMRGKPSSPPQDYAGYKARAGGNADLPSLDRGSMRGKPSCPPQDYAGYKDRAGRNGDLSSLDRGSMRGKPSSPPQDHAGYKARAGRNADLPSSVGGSMCDSSPQDGKTGTAFALQWNINGFYNNLEDLGMLVRDIRPTVIALQEVHRANSTGMELNFALQQGKGKSSGPDDIGYAMLQNLPEMGKRCLLKLLNKEWINNTLPSEWRHSLVIPIPKPKGPANEPDSFRPISLTCCISKVLERMVNRRLIQYLNEGNFLDHRQHAFRPGHGTGTYFATLGQVLDDALRNNRHVELATLDLAKAYNRAWTPAIIQKLAEWGLCGSVLHFIKNFVSNRSFEVLIGNHRSAITKEETGVPQGSVIAVTLFLVAMNGIFESLPKDIYIFVYADDVVLVAVGKHPVALRRKLQAAVTAVSKWADLAGFHLSAEKSARTHICLTNHRPPRKAVTIHGIEIPFRKTVRILGVRIDRRLTFIDHCKEVKKDCRTRLNLLKTLSKQHASNNRNIRLRISSAIVESKLFYGTELTCRSSETLTNTLAPVYNNAIRIVSGLLPSTPADAACIEVGSLPFFYKLAAAVSRKAVGFLENTRNCRTRVFILEEANRLLRSVANQSLPPVAEVHWTGARSWRSSPPNLDFSIKRQFKAGDNSAALRKHVVQLLATKYRYHTQRYSDGSKTHESVGIGIAGQDVQIHHSLPQIYSIFSAEAVALFVATSHPSETPIVILTDSASAILALSSPSSRHPWIQAIQAILDHSNSTTFVWVPANCGIPGNEAADKLASLGRSKRRHFTKEIPGADVKKWINNTVRYAWSQEWHSRRDVFIRKIKADVDKWIDTKNMKDQRVLSRLRTGHTRISHNMTSGSNFHKHCDFCGLRNSVEHVICVCPKFEDLRNHYDIGSIHDALRNDPDREVSLIRFLKDAALYSDI
ncbi:uncharacterized protein LOC134291132 [Aedes albopictus]|uniref:Reverse transcriptase domain-containing protein n=1 Tax=Aedes albopictus TaxID=7160 RepID=A0ABM1ZQ66_AEDAL